MNHNLPFAARVSAAFLIGSLFVGCNGPHQEARRPSETSRAVAQVLACSSAAPLMFKDVEALKELTASIDGLEHVRFALLLDQDGRMMAARFVDQGREDEITQSIQKHLPGAPSEIQFEEAGLQVLMVPVKSENNFCGYVAVGSL